MRTQIYQILYSDSRPLTHSVVKALILLSVAAVVAVAMIGVSRFMIGTVIRKAKMEPTISKGV